MKTQTPISLQKRIDAVTDVLALRYSGAEGLTQRRRLRAAVRAAERELRRGCTSHAAINTGVCMMEWWRPE